MRAHGYNLTVKTKLNREAMKKYFSMARDTPLVHRPGAFPLKNGWVGPTHFLRKSPGDEVD